LPIVTGGGAAVRAIMHTDDAVDAIKVVSHADEATQLVGAATGIWRKIDEVADPTVVRQMEGNWCVLACGEMLTDGRVTQSALSNVVPIMPGGTEPKAVANALNIMDPGATRTWIGGFIDAAGGPLQEFHSANSKGSWAAQMYLGGGEHHTIVVDGLNDLGQVMVRDPATGTRYNMLMDDFLGSWSGIALVGN
jgi:filamentous hemagglutinin